MVYKQPKSAEFNFASAKRRSGLSPANNLNLYLLGIDLKFDTESKQEV